MKLSICVITMNRANQLKEALESCLACELPQETEFIVIDNASTDNTEQVVHSTFVGCDFNYYYEKLDENLGVGGGRNYAYDKACGEYAYMLDDDAVIDCSQNTMFFLRAIEIMDKHPEFATLTTQIYDTAWKKNRVACEGPAVADNLFKIQMFYGGSHFLRRAFYTASPYLPNKYGYEEIPPSLYAINAGMQNVFCSELLIIHKPIVNKWDWSEEKNASLLVNGLALQYTIKWMMYPAIVYPLLTLANIVRVKQHPVKIPNARRRIKQIKKDVMAKYPVKKKISFLTVVKMFSDFKLSTF